MEEDKTDKELLQMILLGVQDTQSRLTHIEQSVNNLEDKQKEIYITIYGDEARSIKGLSYHIERLRSFMEKYKRWEVGIAFVAGFLSFLGALALGVHELFK